MIEFRTLGTLALRDGAGREVRRILAQPKRAALLAYLAVAGEVHRRDSLCALFWPELDADRARLALRQALHFLRSVLGREAVLNRGSEEVGLNCAVVRCDAVEFSRRLDEGRPADALELYAGDLLPGFFAGAVSVELEQWLDQTREQLRARAARAAWELSTGSEAVGNAMEAAHRARQAVRFAPDDETGVRRLVALLDRLGDRVGALRVYDAFAQRLRTEFSVEPAAETRALIRAVRSRESVVLPPGSGAHDGMPPVAPTDARSPTPVNDDSVAAVPGAETAHGVTTRPRRRFSLSNRAGASISVLGVLIMGGLLARIRMAPAPATPLIAVGFIDHAERDTLGDVASAIPGLLATDLGRVPGLGVVSRTRTLELLGQTGAAESPSGLADAARRSGASELLEGALYRRPDGRLRLDVRRVDVRSGVVRGSWTADGTTGFDVASRAAADIARSLGLAPPPIDATDAHPAAAQRLFEDGLRAYYRGEWRSAADLFSGALSQDSDFAMAALYASKSQEHFDWRGALRLSTQAATLAPHAPERERWIVLLGTGAHEYPVRLALAESLVVRYPDEPEGHLALADARMGAGEFLAAVPMLRHVVDMDSASLRRQSPFCRACDAYALLVTAYAAADSLGAAERVAREWVARQPRSATAYRTLSTTLSRTGRRHDADAALDAAARLQPDSVDASARVVAAIQSDAWTSADSLLATWRAHEPASVDALWWTIISLRNQGRLGDADRLATRLVGVAAPSAPGVPAIAKAQVLFEKRRFHEAAAIFDSLARVESPLADNTPGMRSRNFAWLMTHAMVARAAGGDTSRLAAMADSIELVAAPSTYGRDWRLAHHVRGLLLLARGDTARALEELRAAMYSPTSGYTRTNLLLGRVLLALGRAREAMAILEPALRGPTEASNFYVTRTELHELLARAFEAAGMRDSATVQYENVVAAWRHGDAAFRLRADSAARRLAALTVAASR